MTGENEYVEVVKGGFGYGRENAEVLTSCVLVRLGSGQMEHSEICGTVDLIVLGLKLTAMGLRNYRDDVDRWDRNMCAEGQLTPPKVDWYLRKSVGRARSRMEPVCPTRVSAGRRSVGTIAGFHCDRHRWSVARMSRCNHKLGVYR